VLHGIAFPVVSEWCQKATGAELSLLPNEGSFYTLHQPLFRPGRALLTQDGVQRSEVEKNVGIGQTQLCTVAHIYVATECVGAVLCR
jgi:hypothetical protein